MNSKYSVSNKQTSINFWLRCNCGPLCDILPPFRSSCVLCLLHLRTGSEKLLYRRDARAVFDRSAVGCDDTLDNVALLGRSSPTGNDRNDVALPQGVVGIMDEVFLRFRKHLATSGDQPWPMGFGEKHIGIYLLDLLIPLLAAHAYLDRLRHPAGGHHNAMKLAKDLARA